MSSSSDTRLYVIPGSHACRSAMLMLDHKGLPYRSVQLRTGLHPVSLRIRGFAGHRKPIRTVDGRTHLILALTDRGGTVPALRYGRQRIQTNRAIARFLDEQQPRAPLFPADVQMRRQVEEAELYGDEPLQMLARRLALIAGARGPGGLYMRGNTGRLGPLLAGNELMRSFSARAAAVVFGAGASNEHEMLSAVGGALDRVDRWIETGVLGGAALYAADFMIVPSLALLCYRIDLRPVVEARPCGALLDRVLPEAA